MIFHSLTLLGPVGNVEDRGHRPVSEYRALKVAHENSTLFAIHETVYPFDSQLFDYNKLGKGDLN